MWVSIFICVKLHSLLPKRNRKKNASFQIYNTKEKKARK